MQTISICRCFAAVVNACVLLSACSGGTTTTSSAGGSTPTRNLGLMQIEVSGIGSSQVSSKASVISRSGASTQNAAKSANLTDIANGLDIQQVSTSTVDVGAPGSGMRYVTVVYKVRNASNCATPGSCPTYNSPSHNLTFLAANIPGGLNGTAMASVKLFDGTSAANQATSLLPTHGVVFDSGVGSGVLTDPGLASLQIFSEDELASFSGPPTGINYLLPYGFVVRNISSTSSRSLPASPAAGQYDGLIAFSFKLPLNSTPSQNPYSVILTFDVLDDANTRVTESAEEQNYRGDVAAVTRATALASTDLAVMGGRVAQVNIGNPICSVRTAGAAGAATAYLANNGSNAVLGSAPFNLQFLAADKLSFGFCTPMSAATSSTLIVNGSQSGRRSGSYSVNGNVLSFTPSSAFFPSEQVSYSLTTGLQSSGGTALSQPFVGSFLASNRAGITHGNGTFAAQTSNVVGNSPQSVAVGDFNGDGKIDLVVANLADNNVSVLLGNGDGTFAAPSNYGAGNFNTTVVAVAVGDFNGDGKNDLVVTNQGNAVSVLLGNGDGSFAAPISYVAGPAPVSITVGDFNGDGKSDLAVANSVPNNKVSVLLGNGDGSFAAPVNYAAGTNAGAFAAPVAITAGDFNGDGKIDLVVAKAVDNTVSVLLGNGDGSFVARSNFVIGGSPGLVAVGDFNGDGKIDLAVPNISGGTIVVLLGDGNGTFATSTSYVVAGAPRAVAVGDFNGDGVIDLAVTTTVTMQNISVLLGNGNGTFAAQTTHALGGDGFYIGLGDFNGDGKIDLSASTSANDVEVLLGN